MPSRNEILEEIKNYKGGPQDNVRQAYLKDLAEFTGRDTIVYSSAFTSSKAAQLPPFLLGIYREDVQGFMSALHGLKNNKLDLIIHSPGGDPNTAEQIVKYLRGKYDHIRVIIPQNAMSAATMIACAADVIMMGKHSAIGPIDPQITFPTGTGTFTAPAQSILDEFEMAKEEVKKDPETAPIWVRRLDKYPPGFLKICENAIALSKEMVANWLSSWMFKDDENKRAKAERIAEWLSDTNLHKTHGRPISIKDATNAGLKVMPLEEDNELQDKVLSVFHASMITHETTNCVKFIENQHGDGTFLRVNVQLPK